MVADGAKHLDDVDRRIDGEAIPARDVWRGFRA
jgi:hypothetical protein